MERADTGQCYTTRGVPALEGAHLDPMPLAHMDPDRTPREVVDEAAIADRRRGAAVVHMGRAPLHPRRTPVEGEGVPPPRPAVPAGGTAAVGDDVILKAFPDAPRKADGSVDRRRLNDAQRRRLGLPPRGRAGAGGRVVREQPARAGGTKGQVRRALLQVLRELDDLRRAVESLSSAVVRLIGTENV